MDQVKFVEGSLWKISFGPFLNTLSHIMITQSTWLSNSISPSPSHQFFFNYFQIEIKIWMPSMRLWVSDMLFLHLIVVRLCLFIYLKSILGKGVQSLFFRSPFWNFAHPPVNPSYISTFKLVKKAVPTLLTLFKTHIINSNQRRKERKVKLSVSSSWASS